MGRQFLVFLIIVELLDDKTFANCADDEIVRRVSNLKQNQNSKNVYPKLDAISDSFLFCYLSCLSVRNEYHFSYLVEMWPAKDTPARLICLINF